MSPLQIEYLKLINFLQHETLVCTHLRLAEILCRQDYIPNIWGNYYIVISESSIVETQFCFTLQVLKFIFHGPWYHLDYNETGAQSLLPILFFYDGSFSSETECPRNPNIQMTWQLQGYLFCLVPTWYFGGTGDRLSSATSSDQT